MNIQGQEAEEGNRGSATCAQLQEWEEPGARSALPLPQKARCRIQGDGSAWLHSPQVAIAACLPTNSISRSPQLGGTALFAPAHVRRTHRDRELSRAWGPLTTWVYPSFLV